MNKAWYSSKTIWINVFALLGSIVFIPWLGVESWGEITTAALAVINIVLRLVTGTGIEMPEKQ